MFSRSFWLGDNGAIVRSVRTAAQTAIAMVGVSSFSLWSVDWVDVLGVSGGAALLSLLMSIDRFEALVTSPPAVAADDDPVTIPIPFVPAYAAFSTGANPVPAEHLSPMYLDEPVDARYMGCGGYRDYS
jgi:hypothetical protein